MTLEQAVIKSGDTEIPVLAMDKPLTWVIVFMVFFCILIWLRKR